MWYMNWICVPYDDKIDYHGPEEIYRTRNFLGPFGTNNKIGKHFSFLGRHSLMAGLGDYFSFSIGL